MRIGSERAIETEGLAKLVKPRSGEECGGGEASVEGIGEGGGDGIWCEGAVSGFGEGGAVCLGFGVGESSLTDYQTFSFRSKPTTFSRCNYRLLFYRHPFFLITRIIIIKFLTFLFL